MHRGSVKLSKADTFRLCLFRLFWILHRPPSCVPQMEAFCPYRKGGTICTRALFMQHSNIFKWFISSLFIWAVTSHCSRGRNVLGSFLSKWRLRGESPPGSAPHSRDEWFISDVVNEMVFAGVCLHKTPFMFDDSEPQQISHLPQQIIFTPQAPPTRGVMSGPAATSTREAGRSFLTVCAQKCDTQIESSSGMSWVPPFTSLL